MAVSAQSEQSELAFANNVVTVPAGLYLVSYELSSPSVATTANLYVGGAALANESITALAGGSASKTIVYRAASETTIGLYNAATEAVTLDGAGLVVIKLD